MRNILELIEPAAFFVCVIGSAVLLASWIVWCLGHLAR